MNTRSVRMRTIAAVGLLAVLTVSVVICAVRIGRAAPTPMPRQVTADLTSGAWALIHDSDPDRVSSCEFRDDGTVRIVRKLEVELPNGTWGYDMEYKGTWSMSRHQIVLEVAHPTGEGRFWKMCETRYSRVGVGEFHSDRCRLIRTTPAK